MASGKLSFSETKLRHVPRVLEQHRFIRSADQPQLLTQFHQAAAVGWPQLGASAIFDNESVLFRQVGCDADAIEYTVTHAELREPLFQVEPRSLSASFHEVRDDLVVVDHLIRIQHVEAPGRRQYLIKKRGAGTVVSHDEYGAKIKL